MAAIPSSSFIIFPDLPTELRLKIWNLACSERRAIELMYPIFDKEFLHLGHAPAVLHACAESRSVALTRYQLSFGTENHPPKIYFNPVDDMVLFGSRQFADEIVFMLEYFRQHNSSFSFGDRIQTVALTESVWRRSNSPIIFSRGSSGLDRFLKTFPDLKELVFVKGADSEVMAEERREDYSGIPLVKVSKTLTMDILEDSALNAVLSALDAEKQEHPLWGSRELSIMEFGACKL